MEALEGEAEFNVQEVNEMVKDVEKTVMDSEQDLRVLIQVLNELRSEVKVS